LLFLLTTIREIGFAIARMQGETLLEASVLEAALQVLPLVLVASWCGSMWCRRRLTVMLRVQVLKDMFALDDGGARLAAGQNLGSVLCRHGLVALLLSFLVALGPTSRPARAAAISAGPSQPFGMLVSPSIASTAASFPQRPPYPSFRTDVVAGASHVHDHCQHWTNIASFPLLCSLFGWGPCMLHKIRLLCGAVLAHAAYQRREVQNELLRLGGVPVILGQCQVSVSSKLRDKSS
jgi:hypothetical protein